MRCLGACTKEKGSAGGCNASSSAEKQQSSELENLHLKQGAESENDALNGYNFIGLLAFIFSFLFMLRDVFTCYFSLFYI